MLLLDAQELGTFSKRVRANGKNKRQMIGTIRHKKRHLNDKELLCNNPIECFQYRFVAEIKTKSTS